MHVKKINLMLFLYFIVALLSDSYYIGEKMQAILLCGIAIFSVFLYKNLNIKIKGFELPIIISIVPLISCLWTINLDVSSRQGIIILLFTIVPFLCIQKEDNIESLINTLFTFSIFFFYVNIFYIFISPEAYYNDFRYGLIPIGFLSHKNYFAKYLIIVVFACLDKIENAKSSLYKLFYIITFLLVLIFLFKQHSSNTYFTVMAFLLYFAVLYLKRRRTFIFYCAAITAISISIVLLFSINLPESIVNFLEQIGRDPTFTGRTNTWRILLTQLRNNPLLSYGYKSVFSMQTTIDLFDKISSSRYYAPHAHHMILDILVNYGVVFGIIIFVLFAKFFHKLVSLSNNFNYYLYSKITCIYIGWMFMGCFDNTFTPKGGLVFAFQIMFMLLISKKGANNE